MRLARARAWDAPRLARIMGGWIDETPWMPRIHSPAEDRAHCASMIRRWQVTVGRRLVRAEGFLARDGEWVQALYLAPGARGRGLGAALIAAAQAESDRLQLWCFQANAQARAFYARRGFAEVEWTDGAGNDEKLPDVRLVWPVEEAR